MAKQLSEQLAELSVRAKNAEDAVGAAKKEAHDKIQARKDQAHAAATAAVEKVQQNIKSVGDTATRNWSDFRAKVAGDVARLKAGIADAKHSADVKLAEKYADQLDWEAGVAIDYAIASIELAKSAVLDAIVARNEADKAKSA